MWVKVISPSVLFLLLLAHPLQAAHRHHRGCGHSGYVSGGFVTFSVAARHGSGAFVKGFGPTVRYVQPRYRDHYVVIPRKKHKFKRKFRGRRAVVPVHHHYRGHYCPYH